MMTAIFRMVLATFLAVHVIVAPLQAQSASELSAQLPDTFFGSPKLPVDPKTPDRAMYVKEASSGYRVIGIRISDQNRPLGADEIKFASEDAAYAGKIFEGQGATLLSKTGFTLKKYPRAQGYFVEYFNAQAKEWVQFWGLETGRLKFIVSVTVSKNADRKSAKKAVVDYFFPKAKFAGSLSGSKQ